MCRKTALMVLLVWLGTSACTMFPQQSSEEGVVVETATPTLTPSERGIIDGNVMFSEKQGEVIFLKDAQIMMNGLVLSAEEVETGCYTTPFWVRSSIELTFENLTPETLKLRNETVISPNKFFHTRIIALYFSEDNPKPIRRYEDTLLFDDNEPAVETDVFISAYGTYSMVFGFPLPYEIKVDDAFVPIPSGEYGVKFVYANFTEDNGRWVGIVASNTLPICIDNKDAP